ncbi:putative nudix hydrolase 7 [Diplonema papillatum]|nr:putative nudix hydrolase 7 [Diplonema papillatum]|eukprot:gene871-1344_t
MKLVPHAGQAGWRASASVAIACPAAAFARPAWLPAPAAAPRCDYRVCFVRRSAAARYLGGTFVFPGGALDAEDVTHAAAAFGDESLAGRLCAVREAFEEAGALLVTPEVAAYPEAWRRRAAGGERDAFWGMVRELSVQPDVGALRFWCSFTTPDAVANSSTKGGFATDFFTTTITPAHAALLRADGLEATCLEWLTPEECLSAHASRLMELPLPQWFIMSELAANVREISQLGSYASSPQRALIRDHDIKPYEVHADPDAVSPTDPLILVHPGDELHPLYPLPGHKNRVHLQRQDARPLHWETTVDPGLRLQPRTESPQ